ncbi:MAG TPA: cytochrome c [Rhodobacterales bacterium]|nr:cytochrome c [Rhodobacterales bacterium]
MLRHLAILALSITASAALAHSDVKNPVVLARMEAMKDIAANMKALTGMARGDVAFDAEIVAARMDEIAARAAEVPQLFEAPETDPASEAAPTIWTSYPEFTQRAADLQAAAVAGATAGDEFDLGDALTNVAQTCKSCHTSFKAAAKE